MALLPAEFPVPLGGDTADQTCWDPTNGTTPPSALEVKLAQSLPTPTLDALRRYFFQATVSDRDVKKGARATVQLANETELRVLLSAVTIPLEVLESNVCTRRRYLDIDKEMSPRAFLYDQALADIVTHNVVTPAYAQVIGAKLHGKDPRTRICAVAVLLLLAAVAFN